MLKMSRIDLFLLCYLICWCIIIYSIPLNSHYFYRVNAMSLLSFVMTKIDFFRQFKDFYFLLYG